MRLLTHDQLEKYIPYAFVGVWLVVAASVFAGVLAAEGLPSGRGAAVACALRYAAVGMVSGLLVGGVVISAASAAHGCAWRALAENGGAKDKSAAPVTSASFNRLTERQLRLAYLGLLLASLAALLVDCPLARWCLDGNCPRLLRDLFEVCLPFGLGIGALVVALAIYELDPHGRRALWWVLACALLSGLAANGMKLLVARTRPRGFDFTGDVWTTFGPWLPETGARQSFPSGHTATAAGLALALMVLYPRGRRVFALLAVLVACQRIECGAHYLSDVLCSAAVGCLVVACCLRLARWFPGVFPLPGAPLCPGGAGVAERGG